MFALKIKVDLPNLLLPSESVNLSAFYCIEEPVLLCSPDINVGNRPIRCGIFYEAKGGDRFAQHPGLGLGIGGGPGVCADTGPVDSKTTRRKVEMKLRIKLVLLMAVIALFASMATVAVAANGKTEEYKVIAFEGNAPNTGSSAQLVRNGAGVNISIHTNNLPEGAYTVWAIIFNNPEFCAGGAGACVGSDLGGGLTAVDGSVLRVTGKVINDGDNANFGGHVSKNDTSEALNGPGLVDPIGAEVHFVIRYHGPVVADEMPGMIHSVGGGCGAVEDGLFPCFDPQAVVPAS